jgi:hypothetical protein
VTVMRYVLVIAPPPGVVVVVVVKGILVNLRPPHVMTTSAAAE